MAKVDAGRREGSWVASSGATVGKARQGPGELSLRSEDKFPRMSRGCIAGG